MLWLVNWMLWLVKVLDEKCFRYTLVGCVCMYGLISPPGWGLIFSVQHTPCPVLILHPTEYSKRVKRCNLCGHKTTTEKCARPWRLCRSFVTTGPCISLGWRISADTGCAGCRRLHTYLVERFNVKNTHTLNRPFYPSTEILDRIAVLVKGERSVCSPISFYRRHPAHPVSALNLNPREIQALWSQNY